MEKIKKTMKGAVLMLTAGFVYTAMAGATASAITAEMETQLQEIWAVAIWVMRAILVIVAAYLATKTVTSGGQDKAGGWVAVIGALLVAVGLGAVPALVSTLFGIKLVP